jgi:nucleotide-binding universal stress UspA family protein
VAVAVGPFDIDEGPTALDHTLVQLASSLAARQGGKLDVIHAWRLPGETLLRSPRVGADPDEVDAMAQEMRESALIALDGLVAEAAEFGVPVELHALKGRPGEVIPSVVADVRPGTLVIGTLARRGLPGVIIGNTAEWVFSQVDASILAVKHPGFRSPVLA